MKSYIFFCTIHGPERFWIGKIRYHGVFKKINPFSTLSWGINTWWVKKKEKKRFTEGRKAGRASDKKQGPPLSSGSGSTTDNLWVERVAVWGNLSTKKTKLIRFWNCLTFLDKDQIFLRSLEEPYSGNSVKSFDCRALLCPTAGHLVFRNNLAQTQGSD